jgi:hypothetical protein
LEWEEGVKKQRTGSLFFPTTEEEITENRFGTNQSLLGGSFFGFPPFDCIAVLFSDQETRPFILNWTISFGPVKINWS